MSDHSINYYVEHLARAVREEQAAADNRRRLKGIDDFVIRTTGEELADDDGPSSSSRVRPRAQEKSRPAS